MTEKDFNKLPVNDTCPFIDKVKIKEHKKLVEVAKVGQNVSYELRQKEGNSSFGITDIAIEELVLADKKSFEGSFVKLFKTNFLASLGTYAIKIFVYITEHLEINNNKIILDVNKLSLHTKISEPRKIYDGLAELIEKGIIAKHSTKDVYYVDPGTIFRGANRKILYTHKNY
jgi:hypothetical protein